MAEKEAPRIACGQSPEYRSTSSVLTAKRSVRLQIAIDSLDSIAAKGKPFKMVSVCSRAF
jgi:hypothetical protein